MGIGLDIASVDGNRLDVPVLKSQAGITFAIIRAAYGTYVDKTFALYRQQFRQAGIPYGAYTFPQYPRPGNNAPPAAVQAKAAAATVGELADTEFPIAVDVEFSTDGPRETGMTLEALVAWIDEFVSTLKDIYGCLPMIYSSARIFYECLKQVKTPQWADCPLWVKGVGGTKYLSPYIANVRTPAILKPNLSLPPKTPPSWDGQWFVQQYQGDALYVPGTTSTTDLNKFNVLRLGSTGGAVKWVQRRLALANVDPFRGAVATGVWDDTVDRAFGDWQAANGLDADRIFGPKSFAKMCRNPVVEKPCNN